MSGPTLIQTGDATLVARGYELSNRIGSNLVHVFTKDQLVHWERNLGGLKEALARGFALEGFPKPTPVPVPDDTFTLIKTHKFKVPKGYQYEGFLDRFRATHEAEFVHGYNPDLTQGNFGYPSKILVAGEQYAVKVFGINRKMSTAECMALYRGENAYFTGAPGLALLWKHKRTSLPVSKWSLALDEPDRLWVDASRYHGVPSMYRFSDGGSEFDLGFLESPWSDNGVLVLFCDLPSAQGETASHQPLGA